MKIFIKTILFIQFVFSLNINSNAQQWSGPSNTTSQISRTGNIGIGISTPNFPLHINTSNPIGLKLVNTAGGPNSYIGIDFCTYNPGANWDYKVASISAIDNGSYTGSLAFYTRPYSNGSAGNNVAERMRILNDGNVGIGVIPSYKLHVNGMIAAPEIKLTAGDLTIGNVLTSDGTGKGVWTPFPGSSAWVNNWQTNGSNVSNTNTGNIGIGTPTPSYKLEVIGTAAFNGIKIGNSTTAGYVLTSDANGNGTWQSPSTSSSLWSVGINNNIIWNNNPGGFVGIGTGGPTSNLDVYSPSSTSPIGAMSVNVQSFSNISNASNSYFFRVRDLQSGSTPFLIRGDGKVSIGMNPLCTGCLPCIPSDAQLAVNGKIYATAINVKLTSGGCFPDYVFDKDYKLLSLPEVEKYIETHKHLPEIPSAAQAEKDGLDLAEMNTLLLKKVEELTLYMIEMKKEIDILKKK